MKLRECILQSEEIIKHLREEINQSATSLKQAEERILEHVNRIGQTMVNEVVEGLKEPVGENRVVVGEKVAVFDGVRNLRFINRFGGVTVKLRRHQVYSYFLSYLHIIGDFTLFTNIELSINQRGTSDEQRFPGGDPASGQLAVRLH